MKYVSGQIIQLGDKVQIGGSLFGTVVCSIDTGEFSADFSKADWEYLKSGVLIITENAGLIHFMKSEDLIFISKG